MSRLRLDGLSVGFARYEGVLARRTTWLLRELDLAVEPGEMLALVGASGAGKSLLAHALFGLLPPNAVMAGTVSLDAVLVNAQSLGALRGRHMALVPQSLSHLDPLVRCGTQLDWAAGRSGVSADAAARRAALARFGLDPDVARLYPHQLSGGMARRLMLAMASLGEAGLIVVDEPSSGLDAENAGIVFGYLRALADAGRAVLAITHDLFQALPFADRVALLHAGRIETVAPAGDFSGDGRRLVSAEARAMWRALPQNGFIAPERDDA